MNDIVVKVNRDSNDPFKKWGIDHLSASKINQWRESPSNFILNNILKLKQPPSLKMFMGSSAETILKKLLFGEIYENDIDKEATADFKNRTTFFGKPEEQEKILKDIIGYKGRNKTYKGLVRNAFELLKGFGKPSGTQRKIKFRFKFWPIDIIGFLDFSYDQDTQGKKRDIDLKTSGQKWSSVPRGNRLQMCIYKFADPSREQNICFVTKEHQMFYVLEDTYEESLEEIYYIINSMAIALTECNHINDLILRYMPDIDFWKFSQEHREKLKDLLKQAHKKTYKDIIDEREFERGIS